MLKKYASKRKGKEKAPNASSAIDLPQRLDAAVVNKLDKTSSYLYTMLMNQPENEPLQIDFQDYIFRCRGRVHLAIEYITC
jgi:hypothetical protein